MLVPHFHIVPTMPHAAESAEIQELIDEILKKGIRPALVVIDTVTRALRGLDENSARDMGIFSAACEHIQNSLNCTVAVIRHTGKDIGRGGRGSNVLEGDFDTVLEVERHEKTNFVTLSVREQRNAPERDEPFTFEGQVIGPSLVFHQISPEAFNKATRPEDPFAPSKVGAALRRLGAIGNERGIVTAVLATELVQATPSETIEDRGKALSRAEKALRILSRGRLAGYAIGEGAEVKWCLPLENDRDGEANI